MQNDNKIDELLELNIVKHHFREMGIPINDNEINIQDLNTRFRAYIANLIIKAAMEYGSPMNVFVTSLFTTIKLLFNFKAVDNILAYTYTYNSSPVIVLNGTILKYEWMDILNVIHHELLHVLFNHSLRKQEYFKLQHIIEAADELLELKLYMFMMLEEYYADYGITYKSELQTTVVTKEKLQQILSIKDLPDILKSSSIEEITNMVTVNNCKKLPAILKDDIITFEEYLKTLPEDQANILFLQLKDLMVIKDDENMSVFDKLTANNHNDKMKIMINIDTINNTVMNNIRSSGSTNNEMQKLKEYLLSMNRNYIQYDFVEIFLQVILREYEYALKLKKNPTRFDTRKMASGRPDLYYAKKKRRKGLLIIAVDMSGSVDSRALAKYMGIILNIYNTNEMEIIFLPFTIDVHDEIKINQKNYKNVLTTRTYTGGTLFTPVFNYVNNMREPDVTLIIFTDGEGDTPEIEDMKKVNRIYWCLQPHEKLTASLTNNAKIIHII